MKLRKPFLTLMVLFGVLFPAFSMTDQSSGDNFNIFIGLFELPFLFMALIFSFLTANALKGGKFGSGMSLLAWGFLVMAVGHLHMQIDHHLGFNLFNTLFGNLGGKIAWFIALVVTWGLSGLGFYRIWKTSKI